jgi:hypothetical protein
MGQEFQSPFLKNYGDDVDELVKDMAEVSVEVFDFLEKRYGDAYKLKNLIGFIHVFTCVVLLKEEVPLDRYVEGLEAMYNWLAGLRKLFP